MRYSRTKDPLTYRQSSRPVILPQYGLAVHLQVGDTMCLAAGLQWIPLRCRFRSPSTSSPILLAILLFPDLNYLHMHAGPKEHPVSSRPYIYITLPLVVHIAYKFLATSPILLPFST
jgi:hypothetical protein